MNENCFYCGTYTPEGYVSLTEKYFREARDKYLINTRSVSVRKELLGFVKAELEKNGRTAVELCNHSGAAAVLAPEISAVITTEATAGAETIYTDGDNERADAISALIDSKIDRCSRFLLACRYIGEDIRRLQSNHADIGKINRYAALAWRRFGGAMTGKVGVESTRLVSCITAEGAELNMEAFDKYCDNILVICDKSGLCAGMIADRLRGYALSSGYDVISCVCPMNMSSGAEHLIIPELRFGVFTSKYYHRDDFANSKRIFAAGFMKPTVRENKQRIDFSMKAYKRLMTEAFDSLAAAEEYTYAVDGLIYPRADLVQAKEKLQKISLT